ncbi:MAG: 30S ribosomal protein S18 [SAR202 cluster bacterium]|nr:30S ribosomal protein S18 [SAR202 cluster bacterium]
MTTQSRPAGPRGSSSPGGRPGGGGGGGGGFRRGRPRYFTRRKVCAFCVNHVKYIDYKEANALARYLSDQAKIESRRKSGVCSKHQRGLATAIKRARHMAMMP